MARRSRARLPRDMAVREPYVHQTETEALIEKFDNAFMLATAEPEGWNVVKRKFMTDPGAHKARKPEPKSVLTMADANAALDSVLPRSSVGRSSAAPPVTHAPPTSDADLEDKTPAIGRVAQDVDLDDGDADVAMPDAGDLRATSAKTPTQASRVIDENPVKDEDEDLNDEDLNDEEEQAEESQAADSRADKSQGEDPEEKPAGEAVPEKQRPVTRPTRRNSGRGMGKKLARKSGPQIVASVNPLGEEAKSTAAAELAPHPSQVGGEELLDDDDRRAIEEFSAAARSPATISVYRSDLRQFSDWCTQKGVRSFPAEPTIVAAWASFLAKKNLDYNQIERRISSVSAAHAALDHFPSPCQDSTVKNVMVGIKSRDPGQRSVTAITRPDLTAILEKAPKTARWRRNKAMLLLGFSAALRRSELVKVRIEGLRFDDDGLLLAIPCASTDEVKTVRIPKVNSRLCTVGAVARWIASAGITSGYLFRYTRDRGVIDDDPDSHLPAKYVTKIVKQAIKLIGLDPRRYNSKSLREGYVEAVQAATRKTIKDADYVRHTLRPQTL